MKKKQILELINRFRWDNTVGVDSNLGDLIVMINFYYPKFDMIDFNFIDNSEHILRVTHDFDKNVIEIPVSQTNFNLDVLLEREVCGQYSMYNICDIDLLYNTMRNCIWDVHELNFITNRSIEFGVSKIIQNLVDSFVYKCNLFNSNRNEEDFNLLKHKFPFLDKKVDGGGFHKFYSSQNKYISIVVIREDI